MKILYGVPGEGMGHATRSKEVISFLLSKGHDLEIVSSHKAFDFLQKQFPGRVQKIKGLHFGFKDGSVSKWETVKINLKNSPAFIDNIGKFLKLNSDFQPDLVISDFESFTWAYAKLHRIPLISIDNMQVLNRCKLNIKIPKEQQNDFKLAKGIVKAKVPGANQYYITSFFNAEITSKNTELVPPIIRTAIQRARPKKGKHVLVYQSAGAGAHLKKILSQFADKEFIIYGANKNETSGNLTFKVFSEDGFIQDFATCHSVIANGGFSFISEAVYLKKPVYSFPVKGQFEQFMNAAYIEKCGYGQQASELGAAALEQFFINTELYRQNLNNYRQNGNQVLFTRLLNFLDGLKR